MSIIQPRTPVREKKAKNHLTFTRKLPKKSCSTTHLPFLLSNPKILKPFLKTFLTKMKPSNINAQQEGKKKEAIKAKKEARGKRKPKVKIKTAVSLLNPKTRNFAFCAFVDQKAAKCTTCKRLLLALDTTTVTRKPLE